MRRRYIVTYDISNARRLRHTFKTLRNYGDHLQLSVFECLLSRTERILLQDALARIINHAEDQVLFVDLGRADSDASPRTIAALGRPYQPGTVRPIIV